jgi:hypothetical protein
MQTAEQTRTPHEVGRDAYAHGTPVGDNPFPRPSDAHWAWRNGWMAAHEAMLDARVVEA